MRKTPGEKEILNILDSGLEMSFLSIYIQYFSMNTVRNTVSPTDLLGSNEDIFSICVLSLEIIKKKIDLFLRKSEKCLAK